MLKHLHLVLFTLLSFVAFSQTYEGDVSFLTQTEINDFGTNGYKIITGDLVIGNNEESDITDLSPLESVEEVGGYFSIEAPKVTDISGFNNLRDVGEFLLITGERGCKVETITGFKNLQTVGVYVVIDQCEFLTSIDCFNNLETVGYGVDEDGESTSYIGVFDNPNLVSINAFDKVSKVLDVGIGDNPNLESITGFNNWEDMTTSPLENGVFDSSEGVGIINNPKLNSINMFGKTRIANNIIISDIPLIENLNFLCSIEEMVAYEEGEEALLVITASPALTDCYALCGIPAYTNGHVLAGGSGDCTDSFTLDAACQSSGDNCGEPSAVQDELETRTVIISPNPTHEYVAIKGIQNMSSVQLYSLSGSLIKSFNTSTDTKLDLSNVERGMYLLHITDMTTYTSEVIRVAKR